MKNKFLNIFIFIFLVFSLVGCAGEIGPQGPQGEQGIQGETGLKGDKGEPGKDGHSPEITIGENGNWYIDGVDTGVTSKGDSGKDGEVGLSAYEIFLKYYPDYVGTEQEWITDVAMGNKCNLFGHIPFDEWTVDENPTCTKEGTKSLKCIVCNKIIQKQPIAKIDHNWDEGTYTEGNNGGIVTYKCSYCNMTKNTSTSTMWSGLYYAPSNVVNISGINYYEISNAEELAYLLYCETEWLSYNYILTNDIVLNDSDSSNFWSGITNFKGKFDGNNHTIYGHKSNTGSGFIKELYGTIANLNFENIEISTDVSAEKRIGIINQFQTGEIFNVNVSGIIFGETSLSEYASVGGIAGSIYEGSIENCISNVQINVTGNNVGGIFGYASIYTGKISNCINKGDVNGNNFVGGVAGDIQNNYLTGCINEGDVFGNTYVSGITPTADAGNYRGYLENCVNKGNVLGEEYVSGLGGKFIDYSECENYGQIEGKQYVAGIGFYTDSKYTKCNNYNKISGDSYVGGIAACDFTSINSCNNYGEVIGSEIVGGIVGKVTSKDYSICDCTNYANVNGNKDCGALIGYADVLFAGGYISNLKYNKTDLVNTNILGIGNLLEEHESVISFLNK